MQIVSALMEQFQLFHDASKSHDALVSNVSGIIVVTVLR